MGLWEHLYSCDCDDPGNLCKHIHKLHSNLVSQKMHVNTDAEIINVTDMADGFECFTPSNDIKKPPENQKKKKKICRKHFETCCIDGKSDSEISSISFR